MISGSHSHTMLSRILILLLTGTTYVYQESKRNESVTERKVSSKDPLAKNEQFWYSHLPSLPILFAESPFLQDGACKNQTERYLRELRNGTLWAVKMFDASVKYPDGIISGHRQRLGNFDECYYLHADIPTEENDPISEIRGRYCQVEFYFHKEDKPPMNSPPYPNYFDLNDSVWEFLRDNGDFRREQAGYMRLALCVPSACTAQDVETSLKKPLEKLASTMKIKLRVAVPSHFSLTIKEAPRFSAGATCYCAIVLLLVGLVIIATWRDILSSAEKSSQGSSTHNFLMCFSARKNIRSILSSSDTEANLGGVNTLRILFTIMVTCFHSILRWLVHTMKNTDPKRTAIYRFFTIIQIGLLGTEGLFVLGGLLQAYLFLKNEHAGKAPTFISSLISRYWRFLPSYAAVLFFVVHVFATIDSGPLWKQIIEYECNDCARYWWANLLYMHNYVYTDHYCMAHTWSMSVQFHAWILTFVLMKIFKKLPKKLGYSFLTLSTLTSIYLRARGPLANPLTLLNGISSNNLKLNPDYQNGYLRTHRRLGTHLIGVMTGVFLHDCQYYEWKISKIWSRRLFTLLITIPTLLILWLYQLGDQNKPPSNLHIAIFTNSLSPIFALFVSGVVIVLTVGQGLDNVRSCFTPSWTKPLAKLMYPTYMGQFVVIGHALAVSTTHDNPTFYNILPYQLRDVFCSLWIALFIMLIFHMPAMNIRKVLLKNKRDDAKRIPVKSKEQ